MEDKSDRGSPVAARTDSLGQWQSMVIEVGDTWWQAVSGRRVVAGMTRGGGGGRGSPVGGDERRRVVSCGGHR